MSVRSMARPRALGACKHSSRAATYALASRRCMSDDTPVFAENESVVLRSTTKTTTPPHLIAKLVPDKTYVSQRGSLKHGDIIGRRVRETVQTSIGNTYRISRPTLAEHILLRRRRVTPIYPPDAAFVTSLLDLHPTPLSPSSNTPHHPPLEILEAGTGHGSLTIHLARALHAANPPPASPLPRPPTNGPAVSPPLHLPPASPDSARRAILHTLDSSAPTSHLARHLIHAFRTALYYPTVNFHVGLLADFLAQETAHSRFAHVLLDVPDAHRYFEDVRRCLKVDGLCVVFVPSVTQVMKCVSAVKGMGGGLVMERVVEVRAGEPREWDVRVVKRRDEGDEGGEEMVCRPRVGEYVIGGGFVGVWRRGRDRQEMDAGKETRDGDDGGL